VAGCCLDLLAPVCQIASACGSESVAQRCDKCAVGECWRETAAVQLVQLLNVP
jgi:hypothetical protein